MQGYDLNQPLQKEKALKEALEFLHSLSPVLQEEYQGFLSSLLHLPLSLIRSNSYIDFKKASKPQMINDQWILQN